MYIVGVVWKYSRFDFLIERRSSIWMHSTGAGLREDRLASVHRAVNTLQSITITAPMGAGRAARAALLLSGGSMQHQLSASGKEGPIYCIH